ncbi:formate C-acetyltransferase/glycerol dehydratase family glycyl radical enzyme [Orbus sturtevantii]|uniref:glycyl radical protein n=1 Tax=Orbus sturtevantii TaxID=3074109 RepID=UPI00370D7C42
MTNFYPASDRVKRLREKFFTYKPNVCIERAKIYHDAYFGADNLNSEKLIVGRAKAFKKYLNTRSIYIEDDQLFAGSMSSRPRGFPIYPESVGADLINEYRKLPTRPIDPFVYDEADRVELEDILMQWKDSSLRQKVFPQMSKEEKNLFLMDPENNIVAGTNVFTLDVPLYGPAGHITPDYQTVIEQGFVGIKKRAEARLERAEAENDQEGIEFLTAAIISAEAIVDFAERYSKLAKEMADKEQNQKRKAELMRISEACAHVPAHPPRTFFEAAQCAWLLYVGIQQEAFQRCFSFGRFDQYAYPFLKADLEAGRLTEKDAQEMLDCLWMKFPETNYINSEYYSHIASGFPVQQQICVGGQTPDGKDATNLLTLMCIQASINTLLHQPSISVRFFEGSPDALIDKAVELASKGTGHPSFFNDRRVVAALQSKGIELEDARDYSSVGCASVQPTRKDKGAHNAGYINVAAALDFALHDGDWIYGKRQMGVRSGDIRTFTSFEQMLKAFEKQMAYMIGIYSKASVRVEEAHKELVPTPYISCFVQDCIGNARDRSAGGAIYNSGMTPRGIGLADVADSLAVIKKLVFEDKSITMDKLLAAMDANYQGYDDVLALIHTVPKYGNDDSYVDDIAIEVVNIYNRETDKYRSLFGGRFHPGFSSVSSNVPYGTVISALPNGRKQWTPLADGCSPSHHEDAAGPTAVAISSGKLDHSGMSGGSILNVKFSPSVIRGEAGQKRFSNYVKGMLDSGVWHAQFNVADAATLRAAQKNPENYQDLIVRVAGYSAFFTALSPRLQEDVIDRTEHCF